MAYGTESVPKCDKMFGPGNAWVTAAKLLVADDPAGAAADLPAGVDARSWSSPMSSARAEFVAADLLAQAEHGADAQALLVTTVCGARAAASRARCSGRCARCRAQPSWPNRWPHMRLIVVDSLETAFEVANDYAPEHLLLEVREPRALARAGAARRAPCSSAAGRRRPWATTAAGRITRCRPTATRSAYSGLSLEDFQKRITVQELTPAGLRGLSETARILAQLEGLDAHAAAVVDPHGRARPGARA